MAAVVCSHCGGTNPAGAAFCQYCGSPQPLAPASSNAPPFAPPPPPLTGAAYGSVPAMAPTRRPRRRLWLLVLVVGLVVVGGTVAYLVFLAPEVNVTEIDFVSPDNACDLDGATDVGFTAAPGDSVEFVYNISNNDTAPCTIGAISTNTTGFSVTDANAPLVIPNGSARDFSFTVNVPNAAFSGVLTLVIS